MQILFLILSIVLCELVGIISGLFMLQPLKEWYVKLKKPSFNPPNSVFGPVWTTLYALMGISFFLVASHPQRTTLAITVFFVQLLLNFLWSFIFFRLKKLRLAFGEIVLLLCMILVTMLTSWPISHIASLLLVPYVLWVSFATLLTYKIMQLN